MELCGVFSANVSAVANWLYMKSNIYETVLHLNNPCNSGPINMFSRSPSFCSWLKLASFTDTAQLINNSYFYSSKVKLLLWKHPLKP